MMRELNKCDCGGVAVYSPRARPTREGKLTVTYSVVCLECLKHSPSFRSAKLAGLEWNYPEIDSPDLVVPEFSADVC
jgi:hypothetical protein